MLDEMINGAVNAASASAEVTKRQHPILTAEHEDDDEYMDQIYKSFMIAGWAVPFFLMLLIIYIIILCRR